MKLKNPLLLISTFSVLSTISFNSFADIYSQEMNQYVDEIKIIESKKNNLTIDQSFVQGGINYTLYKDLKAYIGKNTNKNNNKPIVESENSRRIDRVELLNNGKKVLLDKGLFKIYADPFGNRNSAIIRKYVRMNNESGNRSATIENEKKEEEKYNYKVAYNNKTKKFGVITGNAIVKLDPEKEIRLPSSSFQIVKSYKHLGLYVVKIPENISFKDAVLTLKELNPYNQSVSNQKKSSVNVEILENFKSAM